MVGPDASVCAVVECCSVLCRVVWSETTTWLCSGPLPSLLRSLNLRHTPDRRALKQKVNELEQVCATHAHILTGT